MDALDIISKDRDVLPRAFRFIVEHSISLYARYHNLQHCLRVMYRCNEACEYYGIDGHARSNILVAALFHDYSHRGSNDEPDSKNIERALAGVRKWWMDNPLNQTNTDLNIICNLIKATEYPYTIPTEELSLGQCIIRDADLMMGRDTDWLQTMILGLGQEMGYEMLEMAEGQHKFHSNISMHSSWGKEVYEKEWKTIFNNLETLRSLL